MEYDVKRNLIDELSKEMTGKSITEEKKGQVITKYDSATNTLLFNLSGTKYDIKDIYKARKYLQEKLNKHPREDSERRAYYEIAITCIDAILAEFTKPVDEIIQSTKIN